jgi:hypothetical protein
MPTAGTRVRCSEELISTRLGGKLGTVVDKSRSLWRDHPDVALVALDDPGDDDRDSWPINICWMEPEPEPEPVPEPTVDPVVAAAMADLQGEELPEWLIKLDTYDASMAYYACYRARQAMRHANEEIATYLRHYERAVSDRESKAL